MENTNKKTNEIKRWTVFTNKVGCKISGNFTEAEVDKYESQGVWKVTGQMEAQYVG